MDLRERIVRYKAIEEYRQRPLIVFATSTRVGVQAMMGSDAVREFIDQLDAVPNGSNVDILLHSAGGDALTAWKLMSELRERFANVAVLVPYMAFSAATIFALGADQLVLHPHSSLGPIDPQILIPLPDGKQRRFAFEDVGAFLRFLKSEIGLTEQSPVSAVVDKLFSAVDPVHVGAAKRASELATDVGERLLQMHMTGEEDRPQAREIAERLNKSFFAHGDAVSRSRARGLQLKVAANDPVLEHLIWDAFLGLESYMELRKPFVPLIHYLANGGAAAVKPSAPLVLPANTPPPMAQQVWNTVVQNAIQALSQPSVEVPYSLLIGVIESTRVAAEFKQVGQLTAARVAGGEIQLSGVDTDTGWKQVPLPTEAQP